MAALTVVFDLDGTLVDTAPDLIESLNVVFARKGLPVVPPAIARDMIGGGARLMIESALKLEGLPTAGSAADRMFADFIAYYAAHIADRSQAFPGVAMALDRLADRNCRLAVCTNKLEGLSRLLLDALDLTRRRARQLRQLRVHRHHGIELGDVQERVPVRPRHARVDLGEDELGCLHRGAHHVHRHAEADVAVRVR